MRCFRVACLALVLSAGLTPGSAATANPRPATGSRPNPSPRTTPTSRRSAPFIEAVSLSNYDKIEGLFSQKLSPIAEVVFSRTSGNEAFGAVALERITDSTYNLIAFDEARQSEDLRPLAATRRSVKFDARVAKLISAGIQAKLQRVVTPTGEFQLPVAAFGAWWVFRRDPSGGPVAGLINGPRAGGSTDAQAMLHLAHQLFLYADADEAERPTLLRHIEELATELAPAEERTR